MGLKPQAPGAECCAGSWAAGPHSAPRNPAPAARRMLLSIAGIPIVRCRTSDAGRIAQIAPIASAFPAQGEPVAWRRRKGVRGEVSTEHYIPWRSRRLLLGTWWSPRVAREQRKPPASGRWEKREGGGGCATSSLPRSAPPFQGSKASKVLGRTGRHWSADRGAVKTPRHTERTGEESGGEGWCATDAALFDLGRGDRFTPIVRAKRRERVRSPFLRSIDKTATATATATTPEVGW